VSLSVVTNRQTPTFEQAEAILAEYVNEPGGPNAHRAYYWDVTQACIGDDRLFEALGVLYLQPGYDNLSAIYEETCETRARVDAVRSIEKVLDGLSDENLRAVIDHVMERVFERAGLAR
jgi:hypothetical protein